MRLIKDFEAGDEDPLVFNYIDLTESLQEMWSSFASPIGSSVWPP
jgi:hypothetical protein